ncbi:MAG: right-handed parallel beta-helix repeat-containing protein [Myxococcota bacterium]
MRIAGVALVLVFALGAPVAGVTLTVNSAGDSGDTNPVDGTCNTGGVVFIGPFPFPECTFRAALEEASNGDTIAFSSTSLTPDANGQVVLAPQTPYPPLGNEIVIDGYTAPGYGTADPWALPVIVLDGSALASGSGLTLISGSAGSTVRGLTIIEFPGTGLRITQGNQDVTVEGCHLGIDLGSVGAGNGGFGLQIEEFADHVVVGRTCNQVTGCTGKGNVISGNGDDGVEIRGDNNILSGNRIGTDVTGTQAVPNLGFGVYVTTSGLNSVGDVGGFFTGSSTIPVRAGNLISGNQLGGVFVGSSQTDVVANAIGTDVSETSPLGNGGSGVFITTTLTRVGDVGAAFNTIAFNATTGVSVLAGENNLVRGNSMRGNSGLGIDLGADGATANDSLDIDGGANRRMNFPEFDSTQTEYDTATDTLTVRYLVDSAATEAPFPFTVDFYLAEGDEGRIWLGSDSYPLASQLNFRKVSFTPSLPLGPGTEIVATATDGAFNTSEFSPALLLPEPSGLRWMVAAVLLVLPRARRRR